MQRWPMQMRFTSWLKPVYVAVALLATGGLMLDQADARGGRGGGIGSRGTKTYEAPRTTPTAPTQAKPVERSMTQPGAATATRNVAPVAQASRFGTMRNLLLGGLIGGMLASFLGTGALASVLGFMLQALLIGGLVYLLVMLFRGRGQKPAMATATAGAAPRTQDANAQYRASNAMPGGSASPVLTLAQDDFGAFERLLGEIQKAYGHGDIKTLGERVTPEMLSYFAAELDADKKRGVRNELGPTKLLQGDLSEAWREASGEWATVAMRYSLTDAVVETATGRLVEGSRTETQEVTEVWTFRRPHGAGADKWELSAIQQV